jgi:hypothetical protein
VLRAQGAEGGSNGVEGGTDGIETAPTESKAALDEIMEGYSTLATGVGESKSL